MGDWYEDQQGKWVYDKNAPRPGVSATQMTPMVQPRREESPMHEPEQEDLSHLDEEAGELVNTDKVSALDEVILQPPQDPNWRPESVA
jgi:hypothetical protein